MLLHCWYILKIDGHTLSSNTVFIGQFSSIESSDSISCTRTICRYFSTFLSLIFIKHFISHMFLPRSKCQKNLNWLVYCRKTNLMEVFSSSFWKLYPFEFVKFIMFNHSLKEINNSRKKQIREIGKWCNTKTPN